MKILIKPGNIYFLLPFSFVVVCVITSINYLSMHQIKSAVFTLLLGFFTAIFYQVTVGIIGSLLSFNIYETWWPLLYFYLTSILFTVFVVGKQQKFVQQNYL